MEFNRNRYIIDLSLFPPIEHLIRLNYGSPKLIHFLMELFLNLKQNIHFEIPNPAV